MAAIWPVLLLFFFQAEDGIRDQCVTGVQTCALSFSSRRRHSRSLCDWSSDVCFFYFKQKTAYEITVWLEFRRVLFRSHGFLGLAHWFYLLKTGMNAKGGRAADRKSTRLHSSHTVISYAVFCLKKTKIEILLIRTAPAQRQIDIV